jgi:hypothetical protein
MNAAGPTDSAPHGATIDALKQLVAIASINCQRFPEGHW